VLERGTKPIANTGVVLFGAWKGGGVTKWGAWKVRGENWWGSKKPPATILKKNSGPKVAREP